MHLRDRGCARTLRPLFVYATVWLHHQHTAEENLLDRCRQKKTMSIVLYVLCSSAAAAVDIGQLQLQLSHYSLVAL